MKKKAHQPYQFVSSSESDKIYYDFETDFGVIYRAYFSPYDYMFGTHTIECRIFSFDLVVVGSLRPPKGTPSDPRIGLTIQAIFAEIFIQIDNVIIAVYDSLDQGHLARQRKFNSWFESAAINYIERVDYEIPTEDYLLLTSVFLHTNFPDKAALLERYELVLQSGNIPLD